MEERQAHRRQYAEEWLAEIRESACARAVTSEALPKSSLGDQAAAYTFNMWAKLRRYFVLTHEVELSNNLAENSMRPVALGRKNWLHVGSAQAGPKVRWATSLRRWNSPPARRAGEGLLHCCASRLEPADTLRGRPSHSPARWSTRRA